MRKVAVRPSGRIPVCSSAVCEGFRELSPEAADPATAGAALVSPGVRAFPSKTTTYRQKPGADQALQARRKVCLLSSAFCMCLSGNRH